METSCYTKKVTPHEKICVWVDYLDDIRQGTMLEPSVCKHCKPMLQYNTGWEEGFVVGLHAAEVIEEYEYDIIMAWVHRHNRSYC